MPSHRQKGKRIRIDEEEDRVPVERQHKVQKVESPVSPVSPGRVYKGTNSRGVIAVPTKICNTLRSLLYRDFLGTQWPFAYCKESNGFSLLHDERLEEDSVGRTRRFPSLCFATGHVYEPENTYDPSIPKIIGRMDKKTSQGKVFLTSMEVDGTSIVLVVKLDEITRGQRELWIGKRTEKHLKGQNGVHVVIADAYMDAVCSVLLSHMVESGKSPHFPLCYATNAVRAKFQRGARSGEGSLHQCIYMEHLPHSMYDVLREEKDVNRWWSAIFQVIAGLQAAQREYGLVHNDLHSVNVRVRKVSYDTILYYRTTDDMLLAVPTYGYVFVILDFGRCLLNPWGTNLFNIPFIYLGPTFLCNTGRHKGLSLVSSEFHHGGACKYLTPDNSNIDIVRLLMSLEDALYVVQPSEDRDLLKSFFRNLCVTDDGIDLLRAIRTCSRSKFNYYLDDLPRQRCHHSNPEQVITQFFSLYKCREIPETIVPFFL